MEVKSSQVILYFWFMNKFLEQFGIYNMSGISQYFEGFLEHFS